MYPWNVTAILLLYYHAFLNITFRPIHKIDLDTLHMDLSNSDLLMHPKTSLPELTAQFFETLSHLLDKHAPKQTKMINPALLHRGCP